MISFRVSLSPVHFLLDSKDVSLSPVHFLLDSKDDFLWSEFVSSLLSPGQQGWFPFGVSCLQFTFSWTARMISFGVSLSSVYFLLDSKDDFLWSEFVFSLLSPGQQGWFPLEWVCLQFTFSWTIQFNIQFNSILYVHHIKNNNLKKKKQHAQ